jgi:hypothetical protein
MVALRTTIEAAVFWVRKVLGLVVSVLARDSIGSLRIETEQLGLAAVESSSYVGEELRAIDERLTRLEEDITAMRKLLEERETVGGGTAAD